MKVGPLVRRLWKEGKEDRLGDVAAMMTYYSVFALFAMLFFVVAMALLVLPARTIQSAVDLATRPAPASVAQLMREQVVRMHHRAGAGFAIGGALIALWGASRGTSSLMTALGLLFDKRETRSWWKRQLIAIAATLMVAIVLLAAMALLAAGPIAGHAVADRFGVAWHVGRWIGAGLLVMLVWALLYWWLPDTDAPFRVFTPGAIVGVGLWLGVTRLFVYFVDRFASYEVTYGALGGMIVLLVWLWLSNLALLLGAKINDVLADLRTSVSPAAHALASPTG